MRKVAIGRRVRAVRYYNLPNAAWDRRPGLHELDYGLDLDLDGEVWGLIWKQGNLTLDVVPHSLREAVTVADSTDVSSIAPWALLLGSRLDLTADSPCQLRLVPESGGPIWVVSANFVDFDGPLLLFGDSVLVIHDDVLAHSCGLG